MSTALDNHTQRNHVYERTYTFTSLLFTIIEKRSWIIWVRGSQYSANLVNILSSVFLLAFAPNKRIKRFDSIFPMTDSNIDNRTTSSSFAEITYRCQTFFHCFKLLARLSPTAIGFGGCMNGFCSIRHHAKTRWWPQEIHFTLQSTICSPAWRWTLKFCCRPVAKLVTPCCVVMKIKLQSYGLKLRQRWGLT